MLTKKIAEIQARRAAGEKGFTLVELLVVVVIIAVLAAIAVPIFLNQRDNAQGSANKSTVSTIAKTLATGQSTGGTVTAASATSIEVTDGTGAKVTVAIPAGANVYATGTTAYSVPAAPAAPPSVGSTWCVQAGEGTQLFRMSAGESDPVQAACPSS